MIAATTCDLREASLPSAFRPDFLLLPRRRAHDAELHQRSTTMSADRHDLVRRCRGISATVQTHDHAAEEAEALPTQWRSGWRPVRRPTILGRATCVSWRLRGHSLRGQEYVPDPEGARYNVHRQPAKTAAAPASKSRNALNGRAVPRHSAVV